MAANLQGPEQALRFSSPQEEVLLNILRSAECLHRDFQRRLKPFGLTTTQFNVLRILRGAHPKGLICSAIGSMMITPEPDITRVLTRLKKQRLVHQQRDSHDRRIVWTYLSPTGLELLASLDQLVDQAPREMLRELNCAELGELTRLLAKARSCGNEEPQDAETASLTGKPTSPHLRRSTPLRHYRE